MSVTRQEERAAAAQMAAEGEAAIQEFREMNQNTDHPAVTDKAPFTAWLRTQQSRKDRVGALARVVVQDPLWPGGDTRKGVTDYFFKMGAREFVLQAVKQAWDEFDSIQLRSAKRAKNKAARAARKRNRRK